MKIHTRLRLTLALLVPLWIVLAFAPETSSLMRLPTSLALTTQDEEEEIRSMRVKELKEELSKRQVSIEDVFEKEELVQRLIHARTKAPKSQPSNTFTAPISFTTMKANSQFRASNIDGGIRINGGEEPYVALKIQVGTTAALNLLLDTACSGFVLRPAVAHRLGLPKLSTPLTMTGAGGTAGASALTRLEEFQIVGTDRSFGPLDAAVHEIGALPPSLDGIVGLSFLNQFATIDMDFQKGEITFYSSQNDIPKDDGPDGPKLVARGIMESVPSLGLYAVSMKFGSRGPVKMLVDSGALSTFLDWNGVSSLGLSRKEHEGTTLQPLRATGAMGSDNIAMRLTHRLHVSSTMKINDDLPGVSLSGESNKRLGIDIGNIAVLEAMRPQGVGGILGIDALMKCAKVRMSFGSAVPKEICFYE